MEDNNQNRNQQGNNNRSSWDSEEQQMNAHNRAMDNDWDTTARLSDEQPDSQQNMSGSNNEPIDLDPETGSSMQAQGMGSRGNGMNDASMSRDNYAGHDRDMNESRNMESRTFNEDKDNWEEEQRMGNSAGNSGAGIDYNAPSDNNWDEYDQMRRSSQRNDDSDNMNNSRH